MANATANYPAIHPEQLHRTISNLLWQINQNREPDATLAATALRRLTTEPTASRMLVGLGGTQLLASIIQNGFVSQHMQSIAVDILRHLALGPGLQLVVGQYALAPLLALLQRPGVDRVLVVQALHALTAILYNSQPNVQNFQNQHGVSIAMQLLEAPYCQMQPDETVLGVLQLLDCLMSPDVVMIAPMTSPSVSTTLVQLLRHDSPVVVQATLNTVQSLVDCSYLPQIAAQLTAAGAIPALLQVIDSSSRDPDTLHTAAHLLVALAFKQLRHQQPVFWGANGIAAVVWLLLKCLHPRLLQSTLHLLLDLLLMLLDESVTDQDCIRQLAAELNAAGAFPALSKISSLQFDGSLQEACIFQKAASVASKLDYCIRSVALLVPQANAGSAALGADVRFNHVTAPVPQPSHANNTVSGSTGRTVPIDTTAIGSASMLVDHPTPAGMNGVYKSREPKAVPSGEGAGMTQSLDETEPAPCAQSSSVALGDVHAASGAAAVDMETFGGRDNHKPATRFADSNPHQLLDVARSQMTAYGTCALPEAAVDRAVCIEGGNGLRGRPSGRARSNTGYNNAGTRRRNSQPHHQSSHLQGSASNTSMVAQGGMPAGDATEDEAGWTVALSRYARRERRRAQQAASGRHTGHETASHATHAQLADAAMPMTLQSAGVNDSSYGRGVMGCHPSSTSVTWQMVTRIMPAGGVRQHLLQGLNSSWDQQHSLVWLQGELEAVLARILVEGNLDIEDMAIAITNLQNEVAACIAKAAC